MKSLLITVLLLAIVGLMECRPQYSYPVPTKPAYESSTQISPGGALGPGGSIECRRREVSPGNFQFSCEGIDRSRITLSSEHILWLRGPNSEPQQLDIVVPNYRIEELIRAALKAGGQGGATSVNILLKKPDTVYDVQAQEGGLTVAGKPTVNLQYEAVREPVSVHYPVEQAYNPLSGPIREP